MVAKLRPPVRVYEVGSGTTLSELLSLAGGPLNEPFRELEERRQLVRHYHTANGERTLAYEAPVSEVLLESARQLPLNDGDVVEVVTFQRFRQRWTTQNTLTASATVGTLILVLIRVIEFAL